MKKVLFLMLFLLVLGATGISAQVRIGGDGVPNEAAVLDLNATDAINNGTKGLALPRVNFSSNTAQITSGVANLTGMLVYNTNTTLGVGVYYWDGSEWIKAAASNDNEIADGAVTSAKLADGSVTGGKIALGAVGIAATKLSATTVSVAVPATGWATIPLPAGCNNSNSWVVGGANTCYDITSMGASGTGYAIGFVLGKGCGATASVRVFCFL